MKSPFVALPEFIILTLDESLCSKPRDKVYALMSLVGEPEWTVGFPVLKDAVIHLRRALPTENIPNLIEKMIQWFATISLVSRQ